MKISKKNIHKNIHTLLVPIVLDTASVGEIKKTILEHQGVYESMQYVYIVNKERILKGVLSLNEVFKSNAIVVIKTLFTNQELITARVNSSCERILYIALKHNIKEIPIIDKEGVFLGTITEQQLLTIMFQKYQNDILSLGGVKKKFSAFDDIFQISILNSFRHRIPWLLVGLMGGILTAAIVRNFEIVLSDNLILAAFIPLIVYMADAVGTQMEAFIIRDLAFNPQLHFLKYFIRQFTITSIISIFSSIVLYVLSYLFYRDYSVSLVLSLSLSIAIISSIFTGILIPYFLSKLKFDPANASGPIATIIQDILSVVVYFLIATWLL